MTKDNSPNMTVQLACSRLKVQAALDWSAEGQLCEQVSDMDIEHGKSRCNLVMALCSQVGRRH